MTSTKVLDYFLSGYNNIKNKIGMVANNFAKQVYDGTQPIISLLGKSAIDMLKNTDVGRAYMAASSLYDRYMGFDRDNLTSDKIGNASDFIFKGGNRLSKDKPMTDVLLSGAEKALTNKIKSYTHLTEYPTSKRRKLNPTAKETILEEKAFEKRGFEEED